jgi:hypothetical protein
MAAVAERLFISVGEGSSLAQEERLTALRRASPALDIKHFRPGESPLKDIKEELGGFSLTERVFLFHDCSSFEPEILHFLAERFADGVTADYVFFEFGEEMTSDAFKTQGLVAASVKKATVIGKPQPPEESRFFPLIDAIRAGQTAAAMAHLKSIIGGTKRTKAEQERELLKTMSGITTMLMKSKDAVQKSRWLAEIFRADRQLKETLASGEIVIEMLVVKLCAVSKR